MKSLILVFLGISLLVGCSTHQKSEKSNSDIEAAGAIEPSADASPVTSKSKPEVAPGKSSSLADAIRSGNEEAIYRSATQTLSQNPNDSKALVALGMYHLKKSHLLAAQYFFTKALKDMPNSSELHNNIGLTYLGLKERREAIKSFKKAVELNSGDSVAAANLGSLYLEDRDFSKAVVVFEMAYRKMPKDIRILNNYALSLANRGKYDQAQGLYKDALKLSPNGKEVLFNYAILLIENLKQSQEGLEMINKLKFLGPNEHMRTRIQQLEAKAQVK